uniref:Uncharacterized protein n=1 Tax=Avena sativa TaxID=4498 RepID=A0ACD5VVS1_AVESA
MNGYSNLVSSPPAPSGGPPSTAPAAASAEAGEGKWEGVAVGAATMVRNLSSASQRFAAVERSKSTNGHRGGGFQAAVRRAFSMRRQPASSLSDGYWRIHDGLEDGDDEGAEALEEAVDEQKKEAEPAAEVQGDAASSKEIDAAESKKKKKRGTHIFKACKKLLGFKRV